eukprot:6214219-Pleurochrysis_carterae.AAC.1
MSAFACPLLLILSLARARQLALRRGFAHACSFVLPFAHPCVACARHVALGCPPTRLALAPGPSLRVPRGHGLVRVRSITHRRPSAVVLRPAPARRLASYSRLARSLVFVPMLPPVPFLWMTPAHLVATGPSACALPFSYSPLFALASRFMSMRVNEPVRRILSALPSALPFPLVPAC